MTCFFSKKNYCFDSLEDQQALRLKITAALIKTRRAVHWDFFGGGPHNKRLMLREKIEKMNVNQINLIHFLSIQY